MKDSERVRYVEDGYVVLRNIVSPALLEDGAHSFVQLATEATTTKRFGSKSSVDFAKTRNLAERSTAFRTLAMHPRIASAVQTALDDAPLLFRDVMVTKPARTGAFLEFHQDSAYWDVEPRRLVSAWVPFVSVTSANGALLVVPGSHHSDVDHDLYVGGTRKVPRPITAMMRRAVSAAGTGDSEAAGSPIVRRLKNGLLGGATRWLPPLRRLQDLTADISDAVRNSAVSVEVDMGGVVLFHSRLLHASSPNRSDQPRQAYIASYMGEGFRYTGVGAPTFLEAIGDPGNPVHVAATR